jgi:uncharacterized protein
LSARLLLAGVLFSAAANLVALPPERPDGYVTDRASALQPSVRADLEALLRDLKAKTGVEMAVVTVKTLDNVPAADYANRLFNAWGIGSRTDRRGLLFVICPAERKTRIEVGYGLEPLIPDGRAGRLLDERVIPLFRSGDVEGGIVAGSLALAHIVADDAKVTLSPGSLRAPAAPPSPPAGVWRSLLLILVLVLFLPVLLRNPWLLFFLGGRGGRGGGGFGGGGFGGGFGGFGGGSSGGGGASRSW